MLKLARFLKPYKKQVILGPVFKLIEAIFELISPLITASIIDVGVMSGDISYVYKMGGLMLLLGAVGLACALFCQYVASVASQGVGTTMRNELFRHINTFSHAEIDQFEAPTLITRMTNDINQLQHAVAMLIRLVIRAPFLAIGAIIMAMTVNLRLSIIFFAATGLIILVLYIVTTKSVPYYKALQKTLDKISLISQENLSGARVIRAFSNQLREEKRFYSASEEFAEIAIKAGKFVSLLNPLTYTIAYGSIIAIIWFGGGNSSVGSIIALVSYMTQTYLALIVVLHLFIIFTRASASAARVNELFNVKPSIIPVQNPANVVQENAPKIEFNEAFFSYNRSNEYVLKDISFSIKSGETIGIIGGTGSGKTTLVNLITRFYDVTDGEILIDGTNVKNFDPRDKIGLVPQNAQLFSGTVRDNMLWGNPSANDEQIKLALDIAQASEFVENLPDKYDTFISQDGKNLSGGQKQRLTIARAIIKNPEILILDDCASALDLSTDKKLRNAISEYAKSTTVIIISQRVAAIKDCDKIIVLDDGEIIGAGTHKQLIDNCSEYKEICLSQEVESSE